VILANPDCEWNWEIDPAPGADDNATGVAALLEFARICANVAFDFDVYLVAFQGEEQGLIGSAAFVDSVVTSGQLIVVDFNLDMLGYNALGDRQEIVTNPDSEWFADWILDTASLFVPSLPGGSDRYGNFGSRRAARTTPPASRYAPKRTNPEAAPRARTRGLARPRSRARSWCVR
jgi:Zn-dependent M28 family amino/carboxypeptidase